MGFVVTVHEGAYEQVLSRELIILLRHVMPLNEENFHLIMPVVKGHCARDKLPLTLISACLNPVKMILPHHDVIIRKHFPRYWPFVWGIQRSPVNIPHKDQWCGALIFSLICLNKRLSKQSRGWWFETPSRSSWRHCNDKTYWRWVCELNRYL